MSNLVAKPSDTGNEIHTDILKVKGKTLIFDNTIYQIPNISVVEVIDLVKPIPQWIWISLLVGIGLLFVSFSSQNPYDRSVQMIAGISGIVLILVAIFSSTGNRRRTGLRIITDAGAVGSTLIISEDEDFMKKVAVTLMNIMNSENENIVAQISFDQRKIHIEGVDKAVIAVDTTISGDIVNSIN